MKAKAILYGGNGNFSLGEVPVREPGAGEVTVKIAFCGICGSDVHMANGEWDERIATFPRIIGHEASGEIVRVGEGVKDWKSGDRVVIRPLKTCGVCPECLAGDSNVCRKVKYLGIEEDGAFQNDWTVSAQILHRCPDNVSDEHGALAEPLAVCCHAVSRSGLKAGDKAVVIGGGPIGLMTAAVLQGKGVQVLVSELTEARLDNCRKMGIPCLNPGEEDLNGAVDKMTGGYGVDAVFEASGSQAGLAVAPDLCHPNGRIITVATYSRPMEVHIRNMHYKQVVLITSRAYRKEDFDEALDMIAKKQLDCDKLISRVMPLQELEEGLKLCRAGADAVKVLIDCQSIH